MAQRYGPTRWFIVVCAVAWIGLIVLGAMLAFPGLTLSQWAWMVGSVAGAGAALLLIRVMQNRATGERGL